MEKKVYGPTVDEETRCVHYHTVLDIVAIKFKCCGRFYPCYKCHQECEQHPIQRWEKNEFSEEAILCGHCKRTLTISQYMNATDCPYCNAHFNKRCKNHYHIYFNVPQDKPCAFGCDSSQCSEE